MAETDPALVDAVLDLATADRDLPEEAKYLVLAALDGDAALAGALDGRYDAPQHTATDGAPAAEPVGAYLRSITVAGFRGVGPQRTLHLRPGPGLTIVAGRNGSGKSSFAEALEVALVGDSSRRRQNRSQWAANWTNLHSADPRLVRVELAEDSVGATTIGLDWAAGTTGFTDHTRWVQRPDGRRTGVDVLGWQDALDHGCPLLPHEELGRLLTASPNELYDKLEAILGLGRFAEAQQRLTAELKVASEPEKQMRSELTALKKALDGVEDERASAAHGLLSRRPPRRDELRAIATGATPATGPIAALTALAAAAVPDLAAITAAADALRVAVEAVPPGADAAIDLAARRSVLLREALDLHARHGDQRCPVCGDGALDGNWRARVEDDLADVASARLVELRRTVAATRTAVDDVLRGLRVPGPMAGVDLPALDRACAAVSTVLAAPAPDGERAAHLAAHAVELVDALTALRAQAEAAIAARDDAWAPLATRIAAWLHLAQRADTAAPRADLIGATRTWLMDNVERLRNQQFAPLAARTAEIWEVLRQESNVNITEVRLPNPTKNNQKQVEIAATVDGVDAAAFSVMSTGELHAITLALFLPRATRPQSPFRFVVLDDPVQAMDPSKVDALVRVLAGIADDRQVVVFSHDDRLPEAARRLAPDTMTVEVRRASESVITIGECKDPAARDLHDAQSLIDDQNVPADVLRRVVPQLCRQAFESAARDAYYARAFSAGQAREEVERTWGKVRKGPQRLALALHADRDANVVTWIRQKPWRQPALDVAGRDNHGAGLTSDPRDAVADMRKLVRDIRTT